MQNIDVYGASITRLIVDKYKWSAYGKQPLATPFRCNTTNYKVIMNHMKSYDMLHKWHTQWNFDI